MADERVRIGVRIRPQSADEAAVQDRQALAKHSDGSLKLTDSAGPSGTLSFDTVFDEAASTVDIFEHVLEDMLREALVGKNATLFAYGQTGSGKTHTVEGLMSIAADYLFQVIAETPSREFLLKLSAVEVYNEAVHDLIVEGDPSQARLDIVEGKGGKVVVKNIREEPLPTARDLHALLHKVKGNRKVRICVRLVLRKRKCHRSCGCGVQSRSMRSHWHVPPAS
jgi:centromeric protein E